MSSRNEFGQITYSPDYKSENEGCKVYSPEAEIRELRRRVEALENLVEALRRSLRNAMARS